MICPALHIEDEGLAAALRAVDCRTGEGTAYAFGRLFGNHGALLPALTGLLTLYVATFAIGLLTGRARIGIGSLTPRMMTLGLVLTFATSWLAYQNVVWSLATGAPDQIASLLAGTRGSASAAFADRLDTIFTALAESTRQTPAAAVSASAATAQGAAPGGPSFLSAQGMVWISGLMLLVGTVGVLVTAKVALAALLALGPVFIVLALFPATRGLFEGWLKAVVSFAMVPMFAVLIGGATLAMITPLIRDALVDSTETATRSATALFLAACVYCALMAIVVKIATTIVAGWRLPFGGGGEREGGAAIPSPAALPAVAITARGPAATFAGERVRAMLSAMSSSAGPVPDTVAASTRTRQLTTTLLPATPVARAATHRLQGVGSRFRAAPAAPSKARLS
jgi:type IV secretion system protein VirB6